MKKTIPLLLILISCTVTETGETQLPDIAKTNDPAYKYYVLELSSMYLEQCNEDAVEDIITNLNQKIEFTTLEKIREIIPNTKNPESILADELNKYREKILEQSSILQESGTCPSAIKPLHEIKETKKYTTPYGKIWCPVDFIDCSSKQLDSHHDYPASDILAVNRPVYAVHSGTAGIGKSNGGGNYITIKSENISSIYLHLKKPLIQSGEKVKGGQPIAISGNTGTSTLAPHLHFEISIENQRINPYALYAHNETCTKRKYEEC